MKNSYLPILTILPFLLIGCLRSLDNEGITSRTTFTGRVIDTQNNPLDGIMVRITNGSLIYNSVSTGDDGMFQLSVDISRIDSKYYIQIGEEESFMKRSVLKGFGKEVYDFGDIPFINIYLPIVKTISITNVTNNSFTCKCSVTSQGGVSIKERGVCWSTNIPTIVDYKEAMGSGDGVYQCTVTNPSINVSTTIYYARAYATNEQGDTEYGLPIVIDTEKLHYFSLPSIEYGGCTYRIYPDLGGMQWNQANSACEDLKAYGFNDWYMPNKEEMIAIAEKTSILNSLGYWTSSYYTNYNSTRIYYYLYFVDSEINIDSNTSGNVHHVIPIRKENGNDYSGMLQMIQKQSDCESCNGWIWNNGTASIEGMGDQISHYSDRSFSFVTQHPGILTLEGKKYIIDSTSPSWVRLFCNAESKSFQDFNSTEYKEVSLGYVEGGVLVYICGNNVSVRNVMIK